VPLYWKVFLINGTVLCAATLALVLAPVSVSRQVVVSEVLVLTVGLGVMLLANALVLRSSLAPVDRVIREMKAEQTTSNARALAAQEAERHRIAQELHDEVGQNLTVVLLGLKQVEQRAPADIAAELALLREATRDGLDDVRRVARQLRPGVLEDLGLTSALASLSNDFAEHSGASVRRVVAPGLPALSGEAELVVYRVAQEALTNAARHAHADSVTLSLTRLGDRVVLEVADDGHGFDTGREGAGLRGMRERASLVAADLTLTSSPRGTTVRLRVPAVPA
jgi:two-component system sensor histidine kinase UhpB